MDARVDSALRMRGEAFGGVCYVPHRDDFFALDHNAYSLLKSLREGWTVVDSRQAAAVGRLARLGLCETQGPVTREVAYSGPSFIGEFDDIAAISEPLVVNCFSTAFCPLRCVYCHADDLMSEFRGAEVDRDIENVIATASLVPALTAVITGGDPISRPSRAIALIERLAPQKALVLDTSGAGDFRSLMDCVKQYRVHVRVSLDSLSELNDKLRPINLAVAGRRKGARESAIEVVAQCQSAGVPVTVQTVVTSRNSTWDELRNLRDWLVRHGVQHWVLHMCVPAGSARRYDQRALKSQTRKRLITPSADAYGVVRKLIKDTVDSRAKLDIRCTDLSSTPNSVLLISSNGDLYTEGLAKRGKHKLFAAANARPDLIRSMWHHVDHFGHARRYLNWVPTLHADRDLRELCFAMPDAGLGSPAGTRVVETESKFRIDDVTGVLATLSRHATLISGPSLQRDEYYDTRDRSLASSDFVVRLRYVDGVWDVCMKGPRFWSNGSYSRIELEFTPLSEDTARSEIAKRDLYCTWFFEKRRSAYSWQDGDAYLLLDEIPELGFFLEVEGSMKAISTVVAALGSSIGPPESRNYRELFVSHRTSAGLEIDELRGAEFVYKESRG